MEVRRRTTLLDQMMISKSPNLQDLLELREENERRETLTLGSILGCSNGSKLEIGRTLLDIIREEGSSSDAYRTMISTATTSSGASGTANNKISWKFFRDRLLLRRSAAAAAAAAATLISAGLIDGRSTEEIEPRDNAEENSVEIGSNDAVHTDLAGALAAERLQQQQRREAGDVSPARVSLMALLEQTELCPAALYGEGEGEGVEEEVVGMERGRGECVCCVCMVRKKGAAFIPCGHTFCRVCSRELWISRGNCPLCNASILEILDIF